MCAESTPEVGTLGQYNEQMVVNASESSKLFRQKCMFLSPGRLHKEQRL